MRGSFNVTRGKNAPAGKLAWASIARIAALISGPVSGSVGAGAAHAAAGAITRQQSAATVARRKSRFADMSPPRVVS